jgi:hypothetical protein
VENVIHLVFVEQKLIGVVLSSIDATLPVIADLLRRESGQLTNLPFLLLPDNTQRSLPQWTRQGERQREQSK